MFDFIKIIFNFVVGIACKCVWRLDIEEKQC